MICEFTVWNDNACASGTFNQAAEKYYEVINRLGQEFENRFCDLDQLEPCVSFISTGAGHRKVQRCTHSSYERCLPFWSNQSL